MRDVTPVPANANHLQTHTLSPTHRHTCLRSVSLLHGYETTQRHLFFLFSCVFFRGPHMHKQNALILPKPVSLSAIYNHLTLSLPCFLIIFFYISYKRALISSFIRASVLWPPSSSKVTDGLNIHCFQPTGRFSVYNKLQLWMNIRRGLFSFTPHSHYNYQVLSRKTIITL